MLVVVFGVMGRHLIGRGHNWRARRPVTRSCHPDAYQNLRSVDSQLSSPSWPESIDQSLATIAYQADPFKQILSTRRSNRKRHIASPSQHSERGSEWLSSCGSLSLDKKALVSCCECVWGGQGTTTVFSAFRILYRSDLWRCS